MSPWSRQSTAEVEVSLMSISPDDPIRSLLGRPTVRVPREATLRSVAETLAGESIGVAVVRGTTPPGLVSERDIVRALAEGSDPDDERAGDVMTADIAFVAPDATVREVALLMVEHEIRHVPVIEDGVVIGVASARDVLSASVGPANARVDEP
jgi:CBS domain-containing protein